MVQISHNRQGISLEIEEGDVFPGRAGAPGVFHSRGDPGRFPVHNPGTAGGDDRLGQAFHEIQLSLRGEGEASQRSLIPKLVIITITA